MLSHWDNWHSPENRALVLDLAVQLLYDHAFAEATLSAL